MRCPTVPTCSKFRPESHTFRGLLRAVVDAGPVEPFQCHFLSSFHSSRRPLRGARSPKRDNCTRAIAVCAKRHSTCAVVSFLLLSVLPTRRHVALSSHPPASSISVSTSPYLCGTLRHLIFAALFVTSSLTSLPVFLSSVLILTSRYLYSCCSLQKGSLHYLVPPLLFILSIPSPSCSSPSSLNSLLDPP